MIPLLCEDPRKNCLGPVFPPSVIGAPHHQRVVEIAQPRHVAVIRIHPFFFIIGAKDKTGIAILTQQQHVGLNGVVCPVRPPGHELGAALVGRVAHHSVEILPCASKGLPIVLLLKRRQFTMKRPASRHVSIQDEPAYQECKH